MSTLELHYNIDNPLRNFISSEQNSIKHFDTSFYPWNMSFLYSIIKHDSNSMGFNRGIVAGPEINLIEMNPQLAEIYNLKDNWNDNGAKSFSRRLIDRVSELLMVLPIEPQIYPTACESIQLEYEKESGEYLEFEVSENEITVLEIDSSGNKEFIIPLDNKANAIISKITGRFFSNEKWELELCGA